MPQPTPCASRVLCSKRACASEGRQELARHRAGQAGPRGPGGSHQPGDQGRQGRQELQLLRPGRRGRRQRACGLRAGQGQGSALRHPEGDRPKAKRALDPRAAAGQHHSAQDRGPLRGRSGASQARFRRDRRHRRRPGSCGAGGGRGTGHPDQVPRHREPVERGQGHLRRPRARSRTRRARAYARQGAPDGGSSAAALRSLRRPPRRPSRPAERGAAAGAGRGGCLRRRKLTAAVEAPVPATPPEERRRPEARSRTSRRNSEPWRPRRAS